MKKIGILTLNGYINYGNRLQNYALQEVLRNMGFEVETIINDTKPLSKTEDSSFKKYRNVLKLQPILIGKKIRIRIEKFLYKDKLDSVRKNKFKLFSNKYIKETKFSICENEIPNNLESKYDYFVTGSDQVWNPFYRNASSIDFLTFAPKHKRIAYAPSFGVSSIPLEYRKKYQNYLMEMNGISVRESAGRDLIHELTGREVPVVIDPTLLLTKEKWLSISKTSPNKPNEKFLLTYFLGDISKENTLLINSISKQYNLKIVNLAKYNERKTYTADPSEFIDYINSSSIFLTDSFHGAVFSILLEKPFIVFNRDSKLPSMNSRIETLLQKFNLQERFSGNINYNEDIFKVDYSHINSQLELERKNALNYLSKYLNPNN